MMGLSRNDPRVRAFALKVRRGVRAGGRDISVEDSVTLVLKTARGMAANLGITPEEALERYISVDTLVTGIVKPCTKRIWFI